MKISAPVPEKAENAQKKKFCKIAVIALLVIVIIIAEAYVSAFRYTAHSKYETLQGNAKSVWYSAKLWQEDGHDLKTQSGKLTDAEFSKYFSDDKYYAIVCDKQGNLQYALYSKKKIKNLNLPDREKEFEKLNNPFQADSAVGSYPPEGNSPFT